MSRSDIIIVIVTLSFCSICFAGIASGAIWSIATAAQGTSTSSHISNGFTAIVGIEAALVCIGLGIGLWKNPDHDTVLGRC